MTLEEAAEQRALELADILREHGDAYRAKHPVSLEQEAVMKNLSRCRTAALGGHMDVCQSCGYVAISYNSCRDRHCPKCQGQKRAEWLEARLERLLPVEYFHVVFTIPEELHPLALRNKKIVYDLLFQAASQTLLQIAADPQHLGAQIGFTAILHTWGQNLLLHPHLHCVVTGGGLSASGDRWISTREDFFLPIKVLARLFRGKFLHGLEEAYRAGTLSLQGSVESLSDPVEFDRLKDGLYRKEWVVYAKPPFGGVERVFRYLGRYTHRVAISNSRLVALQDGVVSFRYRDYADASKTKVMRLSADEFIRRFLLHVLPKRFVRIRHYGLMAGRNVDSKLECCRKLLSTESSSATEAPPESVAEESRSEEIAGECKDDELQHCPLCGARRLVRQVIERETRRRFSPVLNSS